MREADGKLRWYVGYMGNRVVGNAFEVRYYCVVYVAP